MRDRLDEFGAGVTIALITFTDETALASYEFDKALGFAVLRDPDRDAYRAFGFGRARLSRVWGLRAARRYAELVRAGRWRDLRLPREDTRQLGGDVVIDPEGRIVWIHRGAGPEDRPSVDELLAAVEGARS